MIIRALLEPNSMPKKNENKKWTFVRCWNFLQFHIFDRHHDWIYIDFSSFYLAGVHLVCDVIKMLISAQHIFITFDKHQTSLKQRMRGATTTNCLIPHSTTSNPTIWKKYPWLKHSFYGSIFLIVFLFVFCYSMDFFF